MKKHISSPITDFHRGIFISLQKLSPLVAQTSNGFPFCYYILWYRNFFFKLDLGEIGQIKITDLDLHLIFRNLYTIILINLAIQIMSCTHHFHRFWRNPADLNSMNPDLNLNLLFVNLYTITLINPAFQIMSCTHHFHRFWINPADSVSTNSDLNLLFGNLYTITLINPAIQIMICIFLANCLGHSNCHVHVSSSNR